jgi:hypothetical protein
MCKQNELNIQIKNEIIKMCNILTKQNYFQCEDLQYIHKDGFAKGLQHHLSSPRHTCNTLKAPRFSISVKISYNRILQIRG